MSKKFFISSSQSVNSSGVLHVPRGSRPRFESQCIVKNRSYEIPQALCGRFLLGYLILHLLAVAIFVLDSDANYPEPDDP